MHGDDNPYDPARDSTFGGSPYSPPGARVEAGAPPRRLPHSGLGIASFVIALVAGFCAMAVFAWATYVGATQPDLPDSSPVMILIGLGMLASGAALFMGAVLGVIALLQSGRRKVLAVWGLVLNALGVLFIVAVILIGLSLGS